MITIIYLCDFTQNHFIGNLFEFKGAKAGADLGIHRGGGGSGPEFFKGGGGVRVQVRRNFHTLTSKKQQPRGGGGGLNP